MLGGPVSEFHGRKTVYLLTLPVFILFTMGAGLSQDIVSLLVCRFFSALSGSPALAVSAGTVADVWDMEHGGGLAAVLVTQVAFLGPTVGPLIGGFVMQTRHDWRWTMWVMLLVSAPVTLAVLLSQETSKKQILKHRSWKRGYLPPPKLSAGQTLRFFITVTLFRPIRMLLTEPILSSITVYNAFVFGVLFAFFGSYPYVFRSVYGFDDAEIGLAFIGILIGTLLAVVTYMVVDMTLYTKAKIHAPGGKPAPEERLYTAMLGSFGIPISMFWFGWTARTDVHWIVPIIAGIPFGWGTLTLLVSSLKFTSNIDACEALLIRRLQLGCMTYLIDTYGALYGASAIAANTLVRYSVGAAFPIFIVQMYEKLGVAWASSLLGFVGVGLLPIPWVLYKWGPFLRSKSSFQT